MEICEMNLNNKNPTITILVGCPGSGKSTYRKSRIAAPENHPVVLSTDDYIERKAKENNIPYNKAFTSFFDDAEKYMLANFNTSIQNNENILVDRTNVTKKSRRRFLSRIPKHYTKIAIVFERDLDYLLEINHTRLDSGRDVPISVIQAMHEMFSVPTEEEGFNDIIHVNYQANISV